jgi:hypothetical protein
MGAKIMEVVDVRVKILKSFPPQTVIDAWGKVPSTGWTNPRFEPRFYIGGTPPDGILDFDFVADAPTGLVLWVITPIRSSLNIGQLPESIKGVRIHSATNRLEKNFSESDVETLSF